jgi:transcriptional regulator with XRE-family HTH domain
MAKKASKKSGQRGVSAEDAIIGTKLRVRRVEAHMSQDDLGQRLGVSFQQVQKYEKGVNRLSAVRLRQIANIFGEPTSYFTGENDTKSTSKYTALLTDSPTQRLVLAFSAIADTQMRYKIVGLVESISGKAA